MPITLTWRRTGKPNMIASSADAEHAARMYYALRLTAESVDVVITGARARYTRRSFRSALYRHTRAMAAIDA